MPCRLLAHAHLRPLLEQLWAGSVTFRQQCRRLAGAHALVRCKAPSADETVWNAESRIGVLGNGRGRGAGARPLRPRERRGHRHELEHVLERIDGVQLPLDAFRRGSGTTLYGGAYETRRATDAGRQVAKEVRRTARKP